MKRSDLLCLLCLLNLGCAAANPSLVPGLLGDQLRKQPNSTEVSGQTDPWSDRTVTNLRWTVKGDVAQTLPAAVRAVEDHISEHGVIVRRLGTSQEAQQRFDPSKGKALVVYFMYEVAGRGPTQVLALHARPFPKEGRLEISLFGVEDR